MSKVITFSRVFPVHHPKKGAPTYFVEALVNNFMSLGYCIEEIDELCHSNPPLYEDMKHHKRHTIRAGERFKEGDLFSPRVWSGSPYRSGQIKIAEDILIKKIYRFEIDACGIPSINGKYLYIDLDATFSDDKVDAYELLALNDGLELDDFIQWFKVHPKTKEHAFTGQIICWDDSVNYL